jgi:oligoendopeptidase F
MESGTFLFMKTQETHPDTWNLSNLLGGKGASHEGIDQVLSHVEKEIASFKLALPDLLDSYQKIASLASEASAVIGCYLAQDVTDTKAMELEAKSSSIHAALHGLSLQIDQLLFDLSEDAFEDLIKKVPDLTFPLRERRSLAKEKMSLEKELLASDLAVSGFHANSSLYYTLIGTLQFPFENNSLNVSKMENFLWHKEKEKRRTAIASMESVLQKNEMFFAQILNNILDFRLRLYKNRGWTNYLHETLRQNRMSEKTLQTMWSVIVANHGHLKKFMDAKAHLLGLKTLDFTDTMAPLSIESDTHLDWNFACNEILTQFQKVSPSLASFSKRAFKESWIESRPCDKKRAGGFCTSMMDSKETRIFMTFSGSSHSMGTLAHELGHAYHADVLYKKPYLLRDYPMNLAETASTMCEMIVSDNAIKNASNEKEKLSLLDDKITGYLAYSMNIYSRFLFDSKIHEERAKGFITPEKMNAFMLDAQKEAYGNHLSEYFPHFWCYKMHFYFTDASFYNWTYTFGFLFSLGLYAHLTKAGTFEKSYEALLMDTGSMNVEDLAKKHLGVDLTRADFWQGAIDMLNKDIQQFIDLSNRL